MRIALFQPDIPQNTGTILRLGACLGVGVDIIEPCGFVFNDKKLRRAGMDYLDSADYIKYPSWDNFYETKKKNGSRLILLTTKSDKSYLNFSFEANDTLILGRESAGAPDEVHQNVDASVIIPMQPNTRSINIAISGAIVLGEALRQINLSQ